MTPAVNSDLGKSLSQKKVDRSVGSLLHELDFLVVKNKLLFKQFSDDGIPSQRRSIMERYLFLEGWDPSHTRTYECPFPHPYERVTPSTRVCTKALFWAVLKYVFSHTRKSPTHTVAPFQAHTYRYPLPNPYVHLRKPPSWAVRLRAIPLFI